MALCKIYDSFEEESINRVDFLDDIEREFMNDHQKEQLRCYASVATKYAFTIHCDDALFPHRLEEVKKLSKKRKYIERTMLSKENIVIDNHNLVKHENLESPAKKQNTKVKQEPDDNIIALTTGGAPMPSVEFLPPEDRTTSCLKHEFILTHRFDECTDNCALRQFRHVFSEKVSIIATKVIKMF